MTEIIKHINDTNASYRSLGAGNAKNTDLFLDAEHYEMFQGEGEQITVRFRRENLTKAMLFIASILPRKYDNSSVHENIPFSTEFVYTQLAILNGFFSEKGNQLETRTQKWNLRKDIVKKNGEVDNRFYFNGLIEDITYSNHKNETVSAKFTIRNYLAGGYSDLHIKKADDGIFDVWITNTTEPYNDNKDNNISHYLSTEQKSISTESYLPYLTALRTKPFMLLAGISGTGKSRIVKELAFMTCPNEEGYNNDKTTPGNYCLIEVKPNWHDSSELLGYYNALDGKYELTPFIRFAYRALQRTDVPFFVCLDEMNLAPVEQYFAEYLSVLETRTKDGEEIISDKLIKKEAFNDIDVAQKYKDEDIAIAQYLQENGLPLPSNLYIIGTVNMDDTTHQFSRKVIDRAFTIEMNGGKLEDMFKPENANALQYRDEVVSLNRLKSHFVNAKEVFKDGESDTLWTQYETKIKTDVPARLKAINDILKNTPFQVSYRVQNELILYLAYLIEEAGFPEDIEPYIGEATLAILMEKILPRIQGDDKLLGRGQNKDVFTELSEYVEQTLMTRKTTDEQTKLVEGSDLYRKVIDKLDQMHKRLENSYFANFF